MRASLAAILVAAVTFLPAGGCGKAAPAPPHKPGAPPPPAAAALPLFEPDEATAATLSGTISFTGTPPARKPIQMESMPECAAMHPAPVLEEDVIVQDGKLQNVFVYIKAGLEGKRFKVPEDAVLINQKGCMYEPHVFGMMATQSLLVRNSDHTAHNIHSLAKVSPNPQFNFGQTQPKDDLLTTTSKDKTFLAPEIMVKVKCEVHGWMHCWVGVLPHPYFAVSDEKGGWKIPNRPPGKYTIEAWHEKLGTQTQEIELKAGETKALDFTFEIK